MDARFVRGCVPLWLLAASALAGSKNVWPASAYTDAASTLSKMNLTQVGWGQASITYEWCLHLQLHLQKFAMLSGSAGDYIGNVPSIGPLSDGSFIPSMHLHDGPQGVGNGDTQVLWCWSC